MGERKTGSCKRGIIQKNRLNIRKVTPDHLNKTYVGSQSKVTGKKFKKNNFLKKDGQKKVDLVVL